MVGRGTLTPLELKLRTDISDNLNKLKQEKGYNQQDIVKGSGISQSTLSQYFAGKRLPSKKNAEILADFFEVPIEVIDPRLSNSPAPTTSPIQSIYDQLAPPRQGKVLTYAERQLKEQKNEDKTKINEVSENIIRLDDYRPTAQRRVTGVVSAGSGSMQDDDLDMEVSFYEDEIPDDYDAIAYVVGNSMEPKIKNGDYLFINYTPQVDYNTIGIFQVDGANYVKKLRQGYLESLNPDYEDIHLDENNDIRTIGEVVSVYREK